MLGTVCGPVDCVRSVLARSAKSVATVAGVPGRSHGPSAGVTGGSWGRAVCEAQRTAGGHVEGRRDQGYPVITGLVQPVDRYANGPHRSHMPGGLVHPNDFPL